MEWILMALSKVKLDNKILGGCFRQALSKFNGVEHFTDAEVDYLIDLYEKGRRAGW